MNAKIKCQICGKEHEGETLVDECPNCHWINDYVEKEENYSEANHLTMGNAKKNFKMGLDNSGEPLK